MRLSLSPKPSKLGPFISSIRKSHWFCPTAKFLGGTLTGISLCVLFLAANYGNVPMVLLCILAAGLGGFLCFLENQETENLDWSHLRIHSHRQS